MVLCLPLNLQLSHLKYSEESKQIEKDDCDGHLAGKDEEGEVEVVAGHDGLVEEVHAEAAEEVEGSCSATCHECETSQELLLVKHRGCRR